MGHFGFSYVGLFYLILLFLPNLLWAKNKPEGYDPSGKNLVLLLLERVGEVCVTCCAVIFSDFNLRPWAPWGLWLAAFFLLMALSTVILGVGHIGIHLQHRCRPEGAL